VNSAAPIIIATRGSALALAQANAVKAQCEREFPEVRFELKIIKTTGDKLQTASLAQEGGNLPKGLFTKELEVALLDSSADMAVHSLKDLPTEMPDGLVLGAIGKRADVRDALIYRRGDFEPDLNLQDLPAGATIATSSTRRKAQVLEHNPSLEVVEIRGNVGTRLEKLVQDKEISATILAVAGLSRLGISFSPEGSLTGPNVPNHLVGAILETNVMLPCVGQGALGIQIRSEDARLMTICQKLTHPTTAHCVTAERAFLAAMGGGCQSPVAAYAQVEGDQLSMRALAFARGRMFQAEETLLVSQAVELGRRLAAQLLPAFGHS
jgi:hydroxymethylbilane synthase